MPSDVEEEDSNENIMTDEDKQKYQYLQPFFELVKVARGNRPNVRNLFFKCLKCPNSKPKMCQEGSMSNLDRHYKSDLHSAIYSEWQKVFKIKHTVQLLKFVAKRTYKTPPLHPYAIKKLSGDTDMVQMTL